MSLDALDIKHMLGSVSFPSIILGKQVIVSMDNCSEPDLQDFRKNTFRNTIESTALALNQGRPITVCMLPSELGHQDLIDSIRVLSHELDGNFYWGGAGIAEVVRSPHTQAVLSTTLYLPTNIRIENPSRLRVFQQGVPPGFTNVEDGCVYRFVQMNGSGELESAGFAPLFSGYPLNNFTGTPVYFKARPLNYDSLQQMVAAVPNTNFAGLLRTDQQETLRKVFG